MDCEVDDIFKCFVNNKLKQLGMDGSTSVELEKSLQLFALDKLDNRSVDDENSDSTNMKNKKLKKHKKEKKVKKNKKKKEKFINYDEKYSTITEFNCCSLKRKIIDEDSDNILKSKSCSSYHDTTSKIKEIERLSLKLDMFETKSLNCKETKPSDEALSSNASIVEQSIISNTKDVSNMCQLMDIKNESSTSNSSRDALSSNDINVNGAKKNSDNLTKDDSSSKKLTFETEKDVKRKHKRSSSSSHKRSKHSHRSHRSRTPKKHRHRHRSRSKDRRHRRSHRSPSPVITSRDKMRLLEIAKANVLAQHKAGITGSQLSHESKVLIQSGGVTLQQLTGVCKEISEGKREIINLSSNETSVPKVNHPFQVKEPQMISINIKNALPPPSAKPITELTKEYPVSCGSQHQRKEVLEDVYGKWEPFVQNNFTSKIETEESVFPDTSDVENLRIKDVIAQRVSAVRELQSNPNDINAIKNMNETQEKIASWTASKMIPGRFTGSTGLQPLARSQLAKGQQAWANQHSLNSMKKVDGIGKSLLQKMGWREGDSLGKTNAGMTEPLKLQVKTDRKGLSSVMELPAPTNRTFKPLGSTGHVVLKDLSGKHPVSAIIEICTKRKWNAPEFLLIGTDGPDHHRSFLFKVMVNGVFYQPAAPSASKKHAKAQAATAALQALGLIS